MQINEKKMHFPRKREVHRDRIILMGTLPMHQTYFNKSLTSDKLPSLAAGLIERR